MWIIRPLRNMAGSGRRTGFEQMSQGGSLSGM
jgi:hypothetical protein